MTFVPSSLVFSLELFPPKTPEGLDKLKETVRAYTALDPSLLTLTFGAAGSAQSVQHLRDTMAAIRGQSGLPVAAHLTCAGRARDEVDALVDAFAQDGVRHLVALRGDIMMRDGQPVMGGAFYETTQDYIAAIKRRHPEMFVYVAGYPETHPESPSEVFDIDHLKQKIDAGADAILTQFFFDPEVFLRWRDKVEKRGVRVPIIPGLLPILNFEKMCVMAGKCNANVPGFLRAMFNGLPPDSVDHKLIAMNVLSHQITRLIDHGVDAFHFYTMNDTLLTSHVCRWMRAGF